MPGVISSYIIGARLGNINLLEWVKTHRYRNFPVFDVECQLETAKKIATFENQEARELMLKLLDDAAQLQKLCIEMHREFDALFVALSKIDESDKGA